MKHKQSCDEHVRFRKGCEPCQRQARRYETRRLLLLAQGQRQSVASDLTMRRLQELRALGYPVDALAAETGLGWATVKRISHGGCDYVFLRVFQAVEAAYLRLAQFPGPSPRAALWARKHGWAAPPVREEPDVLSIDWVAVERAVAGHHVKLTRPEITAAWQVLAGRGMSGREISQRLHVSSRSVQRWSVEIPTSRRPA